MLMLAVAIAVAGTASTLTDWLFMGVLFHDAYNDLADRACGTLWPAAIWSSTARRQGAR